MSDTTHTQAKRRRKARSKSRKPWTPEEDALLRAHYADMSNRELSVHIFKGSRTAPAIVNRAVRLVLRKSANFHETQPNRFQPGHATWNTGIKGSTGLHPNSRKTQFQPGSRPPNERPVGAYRVVRHYTGHMQLQQKVHDLPGPHNKSQRWQPVTKIVWEAAHGPVPEGHIVVFADPRQASTDPSQITADKLICITPAQNAERNSYWRRTPHELGQLIQLRGALQRQINTRRSDAPAQPNQPNQPN